MTNVQLFSEVFPVSEALLAPLAAFTITGVDEAKAEALGEELAARFQQGFGGQWVWMDGRLVTDSPPTEVELMIALDIVKGEQPRRYTQVEAVQHDTGWELTPQAFADLVIRTHLRAVEADMRLTLAQADAVRDFRAGAWAVGGLPAVSLSISARQESAANLKPAQRAQLIKLISDVAKSAGVLGNAYNSRDVPDLFLQPDFEANLVFDGKRVRPYKPETLGDDFSACGVYRRRKEFESGPIRIAVINTLPVKIDDFVEAMKRQLERRFGFTIEMIRERKVKVLSRGNVQSAVKVVEEEDAHVVLVFVPDEFASHDIDAEYVKSLVVRKGIASQLIDAATVENPDAMNTVILGLLGKTGNVPFVLAEPMPYAHFVVGLDIVRERRKDGQFVTAIARIYRSDGAFVRYAIREIALETKSLYYVLMRDLLPQREFGGKRAILHHSGLLTAAEREAMMGWAKAIGASFYPVEIVSEDVPYVYALQGGKVVQPPWGSAFKLGDAEAFLVTAVSAADAGTPLYVRTTLPLTVEQALHSVLVWTLLHYGTFAPRRLPVTVQFSDVIGQWIAKGAVPDAKDGSVPFWL